MILKKLEWTRKKADWLNPFIDVEDENLNEDDEGQRGEPVKQSQIFATHPHLNLKDITSGPSLTIGSIKRDKYKNNI